MEQVYSNEALLAHRRVLEQSVFEVSHRYPHFQLLLEDIDNLSTEMEKGAVVVAFERTLLYGGVSLVAPFFHKQDFYSLDCSPPSADERGAYNARMVDSPDFIRIPYSRRSQLDDIQFDSGKADLVLMPNLVHHVGDQSKLFDEAVRVLKPGGRLYVFEPLVRELHQSPDDYIRYTPFGLEKVMKDRGLTIENTKTNGGPFSAVTYCWQQALQYFPDEEREKMTDWFNKEEFPRLMDFDRKYRENLVRKSTTFPMSFSVLGAKERVNVSG